MENIIKEFNKLLNHTRTNIRIEKITKSIPGHKSSEIFFNNNFKTVVTTDFKNQMIKNIKYFDMFLNNDKYFFDSLFSIDSDTREKYNKLRKSIVCSVGGISNWEQHREEIIKKFTGKASWNKGKKGLQVAWNKGLTKENNESLKKMSQDRMGKGNPRHHRPVSPETKLKQSNSMKELILNGKFTPNTNNRLSNFRLEWNGIKYRSSWELAFHFLNPDCHFEKMRIQYVDVSKNKNRIYIVDFVEETTKTLYEIKPKSLISKYKDKTESVIKWCEDNGYVFKIISEDYFKKNIEYILESDLPNVIKKRIKNIR